MSIAPAPYMVRASRRAREYIRLARPANLAILLMAVPLGGLLAAGPAVVLVEKVLLLMTAAVSAGLVAAGGNAINDFHDVEIDRINAPRRPLPSGAVMPAGARIMWAATSAAGILLGLAVSFLHAALAAGCVLLLYAYSVSLKRTPLAGNAIISAVTATALLYGALVHTLSPPVLAGVFFAFTTTLAREIVKDVQDVEGDAQAGARTLPIVLGERIAMILAGALLLATVLATPIPFLYLDYGGIYLLGILVTNGVLLRAVWLLVDQPSGFARRCSGIIKWGMVTGIFALALYWAG